MNQPQPKPFCISKRAVLEAWERVKANKGAAGIDDESIQDFERKLKANAMDYDDLLVNCLRLFKEHKEAGDAYRAHFQRYPVVFLTFKDVKAERWDLAWEAIQRVLERHFILRNRIVWEREKGRGAKANWKNCCEACPV